MREGGECEEGGNEALREWRMWIGSFKRDESHTQELL